MATIVLIHGGWHGGWCWTRVVPYLRAAGHEVHAPTLTAFAPQDGDSVAGSVPPEQGAAMRKAIETVGEG